MVNSFLKVSVKTNLFPDYILDDILDDDTPDCHNTVNDNDDENYNYNSKENSDGNYLNVNNDDDYESKYDNGNDDQTIMISQTMHYVAEFLVFAHIDVLR